MSQLIGQSTTSYSIGNDRVRFPDHWKTSRKDFVQKCSEREDIVAAGSAPDRFQIVHKSVRPFLKEDRGGVDNVGHVCGIVEQRQLNLVLHEDVSRAEPAVDNVLGVQIA